MTPDVKMRKLNYLRQLLVDLAPYRDASLATVRAEHYKLERIMELLVKASGDLLLHLLAERSVEADGYREAFGAAAEHRMLPKDLAMRLQKAAGIHDILIHKGVDLTLLRDSIAPALEDFRRFVTIFEEDLAADG